MPSPTSLPPSISQGSLASPTYPRLIECGFLLEWIL